MPATTVTQTNRDELILVDRHNRSVGRADKRTVHAEGLLHRAFSIFLVDPNGLLLLQRRDLAKYHSGGLWANSCCGHPAPGERTVTAARRRLGEELGATAPLTLGFVTRYHIAFPNGLQENEIVHVYFGAMPAAIRPNRAEVMDVSLRALSDLEKETNDHPDRYSFWLRHYLTHHRGSVASGLNRTVRLARKR